MKKTLKSFIEFIREQGVIGLAIGFILGTAVKDLVDSIVTDLIQPSIGLIFGSTEGLEALSYGPINYGTFIATFINFLIIAAVVFFGFKMLKLERLDKKKD